MLELTDTLRHVWLQVNNHCKRSRWWLLAKPPGLFCSSVSESKLRVATRENSMEVAGGADASIECRMELPLNNSQLAVSWYYLPPPPEDANPLLIVRASHSGLLEYGAEFSSPTQKSRFLSQRVSRHVFQLRILSASSRDQGQYCCAVEEWCWLEGGWHGLGERWSGRTRLLLKLPGELLMGGGGFCLRGPLAGYRRNNGSCRERRCWDSLRGACLSKGNGELGGFATSSQTSRAGICASSSRCLMPRNKENCSLCFPTWHTVSLVSGAVLVTKQQHFPSVSGCPDARCKASPVLGHAATESKAEGSVRFSPWVLHLWDMQGGGFLPHSAPPDVLFSASNDLDQRSLAS